MQDIALKSAKFCTKENASFPCICKGKWHFCGFVPLFLYSSSNIRLKSPKRFRVTEQVIFVVTAGENYRKKDMSKSSYSGIVFLSWRCAILQMFQMFLYFSEGDSCLCFLVATI